MSDEIKNLQVRVTQLEQELAALKAQVNGQNSEPGWKKFAGSHANDPFFDQVAKEMKKIREADRAAARRKYGKKAKTAKPHKATESKQ